MSAGELDNPVIVERRAGRTADEHGRPVGAWAALIPGRRWAKIRARNAGGEVNVGERLEGRQPYEILMRLDPETQAITSADRIVSDTAPFVGAFNVRSVAPWGPNPAYLMITAEWGGPSG